MILAEIPFVGLVHLVAGASAISVLFLFVVMMLNTIKGSTNCLVIQANLADQHVQPIVGIFDVPRDYKRTSEY